MKGLFVVNGDGTQVSPKEAAPLYFDFEKEVLSNATMNNKLSLFFIRMALKQTFPNKQGKGLFTWEDLMPNQMVTYVSSYHLLNDKLNRSAISDGRSIMPVLDSQIKDRQERLGFMSPKEIETRYFGGGRGRT